MSSGRETEIIPAISNCNFVSCRAVQNIIEEAPVVSSLKSITENTFWGEVYSNSVGVHIRAWMDVSTFI